MLERALAAVKADQYKALEQVENTEKELRLDFEGKQAKAANREELLTAVAEDLGYADVTSMYVAVGDGRISARNVVRRMSRLMEVDGEEDLLQPPTRPTRPCAPKTIPSCWATTCWWPATRLRARTGPK